MKRALWAKDFWKNLIIRKKDKGWREKLDISDNWVKNGEIAPEVRKFAEQIEPPLTHSFSKIWYLFLVSTVTNAAIRGAIRENIRENGQANFWLVHRTDSCLLAKKHGGLRGNATSGTYIVVEIGKEREVPRRVHTVALYKYKRTCKVLQPLSLVQRRIDVSRWERRCAYFCELVVERRSTKRRRHTFYVKKKTQKNGNTPN